MFPDVYRVVDNEIAQSTGILIDAAVDGRRRGEEGMNGAWDNANH